MDTTAATITHQPIPPSWLHVAFNNEGDCFAVGTAQGIEVWSAGNTRVRYRHAVEGGVCRAAVLGRSNIAAFVGTGANPTYPRRKVMILDDYQGKCLAEIEFAWPVLGLSITRAWVVVALNAKIYVYAIVNLTLLEQIDTVANPLGLLAVNTEDPARMVLVCPGLRIGQVHARTGAAERSWQAHDHALACMALNARGTLLATASSRGTTIRVWNVDEGTLIAQFHRGRAQANIACLAFSPDSAWLCATSDRGTVHIFRMADGVASILATTASSDTTPAVADLTAEDRATAPSFAQFADVALSCRCAFDNVDAGLTATKRVALVAVGSDRVLTRFSFDAQTGGRCCTDARVALGAVLPMHAAPSLPYTTMPSPTMPHPPSAP